MKFKLFTTDERACEVVIFLSLAPIEFGVVKFDIGWLRTLSRVIEAVPVVVPTGAPRATDEGLGTAIEPFKVLLE